MAAMDKVPRSMKMLLNNTRSHMPVTDKPMIGTTDMWELVNLTEDTHSLLLDA
jgi:spore coat protein A